MINDFPMYELLIAAGWLSWRSWLDDTGKPMEEQMTIIEGFERRWKQDIQELRTQAQLFRHV